MPNEQQAKGKQALGPGRESLVTEHLGLASRVASELRRRHELSAPLEDLEAYARSGLVEAARRYDPARGVPFASFARYRVIGAMWDGVRRMGWRPRTRGRARFEACANKYLEELSTQRPEGSCELARSLEQRSGSLVVIYLAAHDGAAEDIPDQGPAALPQLERAQLSIGLKRAIDQLPARERRLLRALYYEGRPLNEVARELGISHGWACRLHRKVVDRLRRLLRKGCLIS